MNQGNVCAGLEVKNVVVENPVEHMMHLQVILQKRLGKIPPLSATMVERANSVIYWRHCIHSECDEFLAWYEEDNVDTKELEMEIIDIMHFVFNIGLTLGIGYTTTQLALKEYLELYNHNLQYSRYAYREFGICQLSKRLTKLIDLLPWKTWKKYGEDHKVDNKAVVEAYADVVKAAFELAADLGMSMERIVSVYCAKNVENHNRQDRNY